MSLATVAAASGEEIVPFEIARADKSLFGALLQARADYGGKKAAIVDGDERVLTYDDLIRASLALGHALKKGTRPGDAVALMLPTSAGAVIAFFATSAYGRVPAMLNFTAGAAGLKSAIRTAKAKRLITSRRFIHIAKLEPLIEELKQAAEVIYLEDVRHSISLRDKAAAAIGQFLPGAVAHSTAHDHTAVILFTSGTEGEPKGVALSHKNLLANVEQV